MRLTIAEKRILLSIKLKEIREEYEISTKSKLQRDIRKELNSLEKRDLIIKRTLSRKRIGYILTEKGYNLILPLVILRNNFKKQKEKEEKLLVKNWQPN